MAAREWDGDLWMGGGVEVLWLELGAEGEEYVRWRLEKFGDMFARGVLQAGISGGEALVAVPDGVHGLAGGDLHSGQGWGVEWGESVQGMLREVIAAEVSASHEAVAFFEWGGEPGIREPEAEYVLVRPSLFGIWDGKEWSGWEAGACLFLRACEREGEGMSRFLAEVDWAGRVGFISVVGSAEAAGLRRGEVVEASLMGSLVRGVRCVIAPAMDGETWVVWRKCGRKVEMRDYD